MSEGNGTNNQRKPLKGTQIGRVVSDKRDKTRKVVVQYLAQHRKYGKYVRRRIVHHVHDEANTAKKGDIVEVAPCRPLSKTKSWRLVRVIEQAPVGPSAATVGAAPVEGGGERPPQGEEGSTE